MSTLEAGLLLAGGGIVLLAVASYSNSRKIYLQEQTVSRLSVAVGAVSLLVTALRNEITSLRDKDTGDLDQAGQDELASRLEALLGPVEAEVEAEPSTEPAAEVPTAPEGEMIPGEVVAEPAIEGGEVVGGVLPDDAQVDSGPVGQATPEGTS